MQYTDNLGIQVTKAELAALVQLCGDTERMSSISVRVRDGKLVSWATDGSNAVYLHGETYDGKGKPSTVEHDWQIGADMAKSIARSMPRGSEVILHANKKLQLVEAEVRDIESASSIMKIDLDGHVAEQLDLSLPEYFPTRPLRDTGEVPFPTITFDWRALSLLKKVCAAAETNIIRVFANSNPRTPIYAEVDIPTRLEDEEQARWVVVMAASEAAEELESGGE